MPRFASLLAPALRLSTFVGVAVLQATSRTPWQLFMFTPAAATPTTSAGTSFRACGDWAKKFLSPHGSPRRLIPYSLTRNVQTPFTLVSGRVLAALSTETASRRESAALLRGLCVTPRVDQSPIKNQGNGCGVPAAESSQGSLLVGRSRSEVRPGFRSPLAGGTHGKPVTVPRFPFTVAVEASSVHSKNFSSGASMAFTLPPLPYDVAALAPHISAETLQFHHGKHHAGYVKKLNDLVKGTKFEAMPLEEVIRHSSGGVFNNAAQTWNHTFYFNCMAPKTEGGGKEPQGSLREAMLKKWSSYDNFKDEFSQVAAGHFGSGWAWLNYNTQKKELEIQQTHDAGNPLTEAGQVPLLCCDVWEHAYYIDRRNDRAAYIKAWWEVVNWPFAEKNYAAALK